MNPQDDRQSRRVGTPAAINQQQRSLLTPPERPEDSSRHAAANLIRGKLDDIYSGQGSERTPHTTPVQPAAPQPAESAQASPTTTAQPVPAPAPTPANDSPAAASQPSTDHNLPTDRTPDTTAGDIEQTAYASQQPHQPQANAEQWKQYHSAWQKYYQLYYERYYTSQLHQHAAQQPATGSTPTPTAPADEPGMTEAGAMQDLRNTIRQKVMTSAKNVRHSKHFIPILAAAVVMLCVGFLQYNQVVFAAVARYTTPGNAEPQNIIVDPTVSTDVTPDPRIIIPKINVDAPVVYGVPPDQASQMKAMEKGVAHFSIPGANAVPGQQGNTVIAAHSSNDVFAPGDYKFVFAQNERLKKNDVIYMNYKSTRYGYKIVNTEVVMPNEVNKIQQKFDKPMLILISCVPLGTADKRLLIYAEQVTPDPAGSAKKPADTDQTSGDTKPTSTMPGQSSPTLLERLFGAR